MAYLTFDEYKQLGYSPPEKGEEFDKLEKSAEKMINAITSYYDPYFGFHDLQTDILSSRKSSVYRAKTFKKAVAMQIDFMQSSKSLSNYDLQKNNVTSYSVDGTSMSFKNGVTEDLIYKSTGIFRPAYILLGQHGLLYGGVNHL
jgi:hypothetical protein